MPDPMLNRKTAIVNEIASERPGVQEIIAGGERAVNYVRLTGRVEVGDQVLLNTTAVDLGLGTGGVHFVIANLSSPTPGTDAGRGHIMKLRYTPLQLAVLSAEEDLSPHHERIREFQSLDAMPAVCCELHSQIAPVAAAIKVATNYTARVAYVMTDGAALPIALSRLVAELKEKRLLDVTITCGQAFGGDMEAINVYSGLIAAKEAAGADIAIVSQGPGNAGTGTQYGFSGIQQGEAINAARILGGRPIAVPRMSFADARERHQGVSHHTLTVLGEIALSPCIVAIPDLPEPIATRVFEQLDPVLRWSMHELRVADGEPGLSELERKGIRVTTMGRSVEQDREFFLAASASGTIAAELLEGDNPRTKE